jgi:hypothetical protein
MDFNDRSGLATSSRKVAIKLWGDRYPEGDHEQMPGCFSGPKIRPEGHMYRVPRIRSDFYIRELTGCITGVDSGRKDRIINR